MCGWSGRLPALLAAFVHFMVPSGHSLPLLSPDSGGLAFPPSVQAKPAPAPLPSPCETRVLAASTHSEPFSPHVLLPKARLAPALCAIFQRAEFGEATACHRRPSVLKSRLEDPPRIPCFWQERQPPPASQSEGVAAGGWAGEASSGPHFGSQSD